MRKDLMREHYIGEGGQKKRLGSVVDTAVRKGDFEPVFAYIRVSTEEQAEEDKFGLDAQKNEINLYCKKHRLVVSRWFIDVCSGTTDIQLRQGFASMIDKCKADAPENKILCYKSDRVARDIQLYYYAEYLLRKNGFSLVSMTEDFGVDGQYASIIKSMVLFVAEQERKNILMRTNAGRNEKKKKGGYVGGMIPYGYELSKDSGRLISNTRETWVVKYIFYRRALDISTPKIAKELNRRKFLRRNGKEWNPNAVRSILLNGDFYAGYVEYNGEIVKGQQTVLVDQSFLDKMLDWNENHEKGAINPLTILYNNILYREKHPEKFKNVVVQIDELENLYDSTEETFKFDDEKGEI